MAVRDRLCRLAGHMGDQRVAGLAFVERDECLLLARANHQIGLPVAEAFAALSTMAGRCSIDTWLGMVPRRSRPP
jgi:hypothetical protein